MVQVIIQCKRCRSRTHLKPGGAPIPLCETCLRKFGGTHDDVVKANHAYQVFKQHGISAETGKPLSAFERGLTSLGKRSR